MAESSTYTDCELEYIEEAYDPSLAAEICANAEGRLFHEETEKSAADETPEYWVG